MFYLLKHHLLLNIVIPKLKCNTLIFNKTLILHASYVCLLYSRFIENHLRREPYHFLVTSVTTSKQNKQVKYSMKNLNIAGTMTIQPYMPVLSISPPIFDVSVFQSFFSLNKILFTVSSK
jgi:hypothetical protein